MVFYNRIVNQLWPSVNKMIDDLSFTGFPGILVHCKCCSNNNNKQIENKLSKGSKPTMVESKSRTLPKNIYK